MGNSLFFAPYLSSPRDSALPPEDDRKIVLELVYPLPMRTKRIGSLEVSAVGLGCNNFGRRLDAAGTARVVDAAIDAGINFFDTADIYGATKSEEFLGSALRAHRKNVVVATKFGMKVDEARHGAHPDYVRRAAADSLRRLGIDCIDLYQLHTPDPTVPIADTLGALHELVREGKVREIGCSNFSVDQLREARRAAGDGPHFVSVQNEYSLLHRAPEEDGVLAACAEEGVAFLPFFPLASGLLTGKYRRGEPAPQGRLADQWNAGKVDEAKLSVVERLTTFAESRGHSILDLAFSWLLARDPVASVIAGATRPDQIAANVAAANWTLTAQELREVDRLASL
jgi:aryl-alcohol dehydrogenase-like predicted oxidoreductase